MTHPTTGDQPDARQRLSIAVFSGATATIQNTTPLVTSNQARRRHHLPMLDVEGYDALRPQKLARPVTVYIEAFTAHPLEEDAAELYAPPDGYVDADGVFHRERVAASDVPVYEAELHPEDGLFMLPYMARQADGSAWEASAARHDSEFAEVRQTFFPDASRLVEEIDRFGLDGAGRNNLLSRQANFDFFRAAPSGGYTRGLDADRRTDTGTGDIPAEVGGEHFFYYQPTHLAQGPGMPTLAHVTNMVQEALDRDVYDGAIWLEGSPSLEDTVYWLSLLIDTRIPMCGNASQRPHGALSNDGDRNIVDSVEYIRSRVWSDAGLDSVGGVVVQDQQIFAAREVQKADARPGGYVATGGHGGIIGRVGELGSPVLTFRPNKRHTFTSDVNMRNLPTSVRGVSGTPTNVSSKAVDVLTAQRQLLASAIPKVTICKFTRYGMDDTGDDPAQEVEIAARIARNLERFPLAGFVLEGNTPFGRTDESMTTALVRATLSGMPVVCVGRGNAEGMVPDLPEPLFLAGSNLTATKARMLLMACLLRFGAPPPAANPLCPTTVERKRILTYLAELQEVFNTH